MMYDLEHSAIERLAISPSGFAFDPETGQSFSVNETGLAALAELRSRRSLPQVATSLARDYDVSEEAALAGLEAFLGQLKRFLRW